MLDATPNGQISFATEKAKALLKRYFPTSERLPESLMRCVSSQAVNGTPVLLPWIAEDGEKQLAVRLTGKQDRHIQLLLEEKAHALSADQLKAALKLTEREAEVLLWITRGKTNPETAAILNCKAGTVAKHTERIFSKLGVETRTAAAALALEAFGEVCVQNSARASHHNGSQAAPRHRELRA